MEISIGADMIRLGQLLKFANVVDDGAEAKFLITTGAVSVDGQVVTERGRQVHPGSVVELSVAGQTVTLNVAP